MNEELVKSLTDLIDETIAEIEDLKKSDRFSASEVKIEGPGDGIAGKPVNGELDAKKADDEEEDDEKDEKDEKKEVEKGVNEQADPDAGHHQPVAKMDEEVEKGVNELSDKKEVEKGANECADPNAGSHEPVAKECGMKKSEEEEKTEDELAKSIEASETLMKSYIDEKMAPMEEKISSMFDMIKELADTPVERKGVPSGVQPLQKSEAEVESLSKSDVVEKLLELKKSDPSSVPTQDVTRAELGGPADLDDLVNKYNLRG